MKERQRKSIEKRVVADCSSRASSYTTPYFSFISHRWFACLCMCMSVCPYVCFFSTRERKKRHRRKRIEKCAVDLNVRFFLEIKKGKYFNFNVFLIQQNSQCFVIVSYMCVRVCTCVVYTFFVILLFLFVCSVRASMCSTLVY